MRAAAFVVTLTVVAMAALPAGAFWPSPAGLAQAPPAFPIVLVTDGADDIFPDYSVPSAPPNPYGVLDVRRLSVADETTEYLVFDLGLAYVHTESPGQAPVLGFNAEYNVNFTLEGSSTNYNLQITPGFRRYADDPNSGAVLHLADAQLCILDAGDCKGIWVPEDVETRPADGVLRILVQKAHLAGRWDGWVRTLDGPVRNGSTLSNFHVDSHIRDLQGNPREEPQGRFHDDASGGSNKYALRSNAANVNVEVRVAHGQRWVPVLPGEPLPVPFAVVNHAAERRTFAVSYGIMMDDLSGRPDESAKYRVTGPISVSLPAGQWRNYTLMLQGDHAISGMPEGHAWPVLHVRVEAEGSGDLGTAWAQLSPAFALGPSSKRLYPQTTRDAIADAACPEAACITNIYLSTVADGQPATGYACEGLRSSSQGGWKSMRTREVQGVPIAFDGQGRGTFHAHIAASRADAGSITALVELRQGEPAVVLASGSKEFTLTTAGADVDVPLTVQLEAPHFLGAPGPAIQALMVFTKTDPTVDDALSNQVCWKVSGAYLELPLVEVPEQYRYSLGPSPFTLALDGNVEEFVNPGEGHLFNVTVTNLDSKEQRLRLSAGTQATGWPVRLLPGNVFMLPAGDSVRVGLLVEAPGGAGEGARANITLNATADDMTVRSQRFVLTAIQEDVWDGRGRFEPDPGDEGKAVRPPSPASGLPSSLFMAALAVAAAILGRRSRHHE